MSAALPLSAYVHLPWCVRKCPYCDFNSHKAGPPAQRERYLEALFTDVQQDAGKVAGRSIETVFLGGGTPSLFSPQQIGAIIARLGECLDLAPDAEITMEANPGTLEHGSLAGYREAGVNRLSLGAQSFDADSLARLGRIHGPDEILAVFQEARDAGFDNINVDLMHALPGQTPAAALADLEAALALDPEHISYYQLTLEPNTVFHARPPEDLPDEEQVFDIQDAGMERLGAAGFERYEISAYAKAGRQCRHNLNYWRFGDYLGVGAGAHGKLTSPESGVRRSEKIANPQQYTEHMESRSEAARWKAVPEDELPFEFMLNALRLAEGFSMQLYEAHTGLSEQSVRGTLDDLAERGLMSCDPDHIWRPTRQGYRFVNDLQGAFLPG